jgi:peptidoglycan/xylan/chitin deacetylase (PgdA/CDA1 family)
MAAEMLGKREFVARLSARFGVTSAIEFLPKRHQLLILNYHRIGNPAATPYDSGTFSATTEEFDEQIGYLKRRFHMATLEEALESTPSATSVLITFDDGYLDNYTEAFPILKSHGVQGVFFLPTAFVGTGQIPWWDSIAYILKHSRNREIQLDYPESAHFDLDREPVLRVIEQVLGIAKRSEVRTDLLIGDLERACDCPRPSGGEDRCFLSWEEAREMKGAGMAFGSHTHTHEILSKLTPDRQMEELKVSREIMERELGQPIRTLAYPVGAPSTFSAVTMDAAEKAGYVAAFSFFGGINRPGQIERFNIRRVGVASPSIPRLRLQTALVAVTGSVWF